MASTTIKNTSNGKKSCSLADEEDKTQSRQVKLHCDHKSASLTPSRRTTSLTDLGNGRTAVKLAETSFPLHFDGRNPVSLRILLRSVEDLNGPVSEEVITATLTRT